MLESGCTTCAAPPPRSVGVREWGRSLAAICSIWLMAILPITNSAVAAKLECAASASPTAVAVGEATTFTANATGGKSPYYYNWSFPGGNPAASTSRVQNVTYGTPGTKTGTVTVTDDAGGRGKGKSCTASATVTVTQGQQEVCTISVSPTTLAFGSVNVGSPATLGTTVSNSGTAACDVTLVRTGSTDFTVAPPTTFSVAPGGSQSVSVSYGPNAAGPDTGTLNVNSNDPDSPSIAVSLSGTGVQQQQACNLSVNPTALAFGNVTVNTSSTLGTTVSNSGNLTCNVTLNRSGSNDFAITSPSSFNVTPGGSANVSVSYTPGQVGTDTGQVAVTSNDPNSPAVVSLSGTGVDQQAQCTTPPDTSINSTSQSGCPGVKVDEQPIVANNNYTVLAINDLGMHCGDLDTRIASILPPFQVLLAQVVQKGSSPTLNPAGVSIYYSAASNPNDPVANVFDGVMGNGDTYKTNFWDYPIPAGTYDAFYPAYNPFNISQTLTPLSGPPFNVSADVGLPVPNLENLYIGPDGQVNSGDESLTAVLHAMPGVAGPYLANDPKLTQEHYLDKPFFVNFPFGYVAADVNWYEGAGIPFSAFDDYGRENAYPLVRVQAKQGNTTLATVDTVLPISGEASCMNCHTTADDYASVYGNTTNHRTNGPTDALSGNNPPLPVATTMSDPSIGDVPPRVSLEYAADINVLRLHDLDHGAEYVTTACDAPGQNCLLTAPAPCDITANGGNGDANCLTNKALVQNQPVVCQVCHYTPALDLAQVGPAGRSRPGTIANGRNQVAHQSNSRVMHNHHGSLPNNLFPPIPPPSQNSSGVITNQAARLDAMELSCYQCHPGTSVKCLRGAMFNADMLCSDCHGDMQQVGADFSAGVSPDQPGGLHPRPGQLLHPDSDQPRVPWANEPGCGSCHTGDAVSNLAGSANVRVNNRDSNGNLDGYPSAPGLPHRRRQGHAHRADQQALCGGPRCRPASMASPIRARAIPSSIA